MKKLILSTLLLPFAGKTGIIPSSPSTTTVEIRSGAWPMSLEKEVGRSGKSYSLIFRDQQVMDAEVLDTLPFPNVEQLKFFGKALTYLKTGHNGDIAQFNISTVSVSQIINLNATQSAVRIRCNLARNASQSATLMKLVSKPTFPSASPISASVLASRSIGGSV